jgi:hypothetical protein
MKRRKMLAILLVCTCFANPIGACANMVVSTGEFLKPFFFGFGGNVFPS